MVLKISFPAPTGAPISSVDSRADLSGLIVRTAAGVARAGILPRTTAALVTSRASMGVDVAAFESVLVRNGLPAFSDNDGSVTVAGLTAPGANSWYSIIFCKQNETESPFSDANNLPVFGVVTGTAAAIPDLAAAVALVPAGGLALAAVLIPSTATTTQSAGVVITQIAPFTALTGGPIWARTKADLDLITGFAAGQGGFVTADLALWVFSGTAWVVPGLRLSNVPTSIIFGAIPPANARIIEYSDRVSVNTVASGDATFAYPAAFPNGVISVTLHRFGFGTYGVTSEIGNSATQSLTNYNFRIFQASGAVLASLNGIPYTYRAIGW